MNSYSQFGEDRWIMENVPLPDHGTFCEVGASDGRHASNTLLFEEAEWNGFCVEPVPELAIQCRAARKQVICCAVTRFYGIGTFSLNTDNPGASGFRRPGNPILVPCLRLDVMCSDHLGCSPFLLSIDTEGSEDEVIVSMGIYRPNIIIVEYKTFDDPPRDIELKKLLKPMGYSEIHRTECNLIFTR